MAVHYTCDVCEQPIPEHMRPLVLTIPIHTFETLAGGMAYVDLETMEPISGRMVSFDMCLACANKMWTNTVQSLKLKCPADQMTDHMKREDKADG